MLFYADIVECAIIEPYKNNGTCIDLINDWANQAIAEHIMHTITEVYITVSFIYVWRYAVSELNNMCVHLSSMNSTNFRTKKWDGCALFLPFYVASIQIHTF